jgi:hypothetical protein
MLHIKNVVCYRGIPKKEKEKKKEKENHCKRFFLHFLRVTYSLIKK